MRGTEKDAKESRGAILTRAGLPMPMPEVEHGMTDIIEELGWCQFTGMGAAPLSAGEIAAWCGLMQERLTPWEASMLRRMSEAFCAGVTAERAPYEPLLVRMAIASASFMVP